MKWDEIAQQYSEDAFFPISKVHKNNTPRITQTRTAADGDDHQFDDWICLYIDSTHWYWKHNIEPVCSTSIIGDVEPVLVVLRCSWFLHVQCVSDFTSYLFFEHDMAQTFTVQYIIAYGVFSWNQVVVLSDLVVAIVSSNNMRGHFRQIDQIRFHIIDDVSPNMLNSQRDHSTVLSCQGELQNVLRAFFALITEMRQFRWAMKKKQIVYCI